MIAIFLDISRVVVGSLNAFTERQSFGALISICGSGRAWLGGDATPEHVSMRIAA